MRQLFMGLALLTGLFSCHQKHYKGVLMDGGCSMREIPGQEPQVVCPEPEAN